MPGFPWAVVCFADMGVTAGSARLFSAHAQDLGYFSSLPAAKFLPRLDKSIYEAQSGAGPHDTY